MYYLLFVIILCILNSSYCYYFHKNVYKTKLADYTAVGMVSDITTTSCTLIISSIFDLHNTAKRKGGDKYNSYIINETKGIEFNIYVHQIISRRINNTNIVSPHQRIIINIYNDDIEQQHNGIINKLYKCQLDKVAIKSGGDRYQGDIDGEKFTLYLPQHLSRNINDNTTNIKNWIIISFHPIENNDIIA